MRFRLTLFLLIGLGCFAGEVTAAVFSLRPSTDSGRIIRATGLPGAEQKVWDEAMTINGYNSRIRIDLCQETSAELLDGIRKRHANATASNRGGTLVVDIPEGKMRMRHLFIDADAVTLRFTVQVPERLPAPVWPRELPVINGATPVMSMGFPERGTASVQFQMSGDAAGNLNGIVHELSAAGWLATPASLSGDTGNLGGTIFLSADGKKMISLGLQSSESGALVSTGFLVLNTLSSGE